MDTKISVVICTYNRPERVIGLVEQLLQCNPVPNEIIVVDSSDELNTYLVTDPNVVYQQSIHKNQPYQRFLGASVAQSDFLLFLDDDMEIMETSVFEIIDMHLSSGEHITGLALNFKDKHQDTSLSMVPKSKLKHLGSNFQKVKGWITGYPIQKEGKLGLCGNRGKKPLDNSEMEYVSGGAFVAKKSALFENFNFQLLSFFEQKLGMGEDTIIGFCLSKQGKLINVPAILFLHNDQKDSNYAADILKFSERVLFSRLYLSLERNRLLGKSLIFAKLHYHWYALNRIIGLSINFVLQPTPKRKKALKGAFLGWKQTVGLNFAKDLEENEKWLKEINTNRSKY